MFSRRWAFVLAAALCCVPASAAPVNYTLSTFGSGTLGSDSFNNALITITATGDTSSISGGGNFFTINPTTTSVSVAGLGTWLVNETGTYVYNNENYAGTGYAGYQADNFFISVHNDALKNYGLTGIVGPFTSDSEDDSGYLNTSGGLLQVDYYGPNATFQSNASVAPTPEPSSVALLGSGLISIAGFAFYRRRNQTISLQSF